MSKKPRRFKIYRDEAKERLTNHWDWDYMGFDSTDEGFIQTTRLVNPEPTGSSESTTRSFLARVLAAFRFPRSRD